MNILFHVLSEALEDSPFVYGIACCCMSGWWLCVTTVLTSNVSVCCSIWDSLFGFFITRACCSSLSWTSLVGSFYYFYMIDLLLQHECKVPAHLFEFCFLVLFIILQCQTGLGALDSLIMKIFLAMLVLFCYAYAILQWHCVSYQHGWFEYLFISCLSGWSNQLSEYAANSAKYSWLSREQWLGY